MLSRDRNRALAWTSAVPAGFQHLPKQCRFSAEYTGHKAPATCDSQEESDHEDVSPLQPGKGSWYRLEGEQRCSDTHGVGHHNLRPNTPHDTAHSHC